MIPYEVTRRNVGNSMNIATGVFTAIVNGRYHFSFIALSWSSGVYNSVYLRVNGVNIGISWHRRWDDTVCHSCPCKQSAMQDYNVRDCLHGIHSSPSLLATAVSKLKSTSSLFKNWAEFISNIYKNSAINFINLLSKSIKPINIKITSSNH